MCLVLVVIIVFIGGVVKNVVGFFIMKRIKITVEVTRDIKHEFLCDENAELRPVDFGQIIVTRLIGFTKDFEKKNIDMEFFEFWEDPEKAERLFPMFEAKDGQGMTFHYPVTKVCVLGD